MSRGYCHGNGVRSSHLVEYAVCMDQLSYCRHRFPPAVIQHAIWPYLRFTLSYRDVEDLSAERGLEVSYETVRRWVLKFGPAIARRLRGAAHGHCHGNGVRASHPLGVGCLHGSALVLPAPLPACGYPL